MRLQPLAAVALATSALITAPAQADEPYPSRPIRLLVGSSPGGGTDLMARLVGERLGEALKATIVVENKPGASNTLAADAVAKARPDGYTLLMGVVTSQAIAPHLLKLGFDVNKDLVPVALVSQVPNVLVVNNGLKARSVAELIELARAQPGKLAYASSGAGSTQHIAGEAFKRFSGTQIVHVPYKGSGPAMVDLIGGQVQLSFDTLPSVIGHLQAQRVRALAVTTAKRSPLLPDVPTLAEAGVKGLAMSAWYGVYAPAGTPRAIVERLNKEIAVVLAQPEVVKKLAAAGAEPGDMSLAQFAQFQASEYARFGQLIKDTGIHVD
ncbi:MAG: tripartite tricarboxylate transporter substrate binding protein [Betaproteobacteria bacterium]|nr:MAG: tripartite tricarboxylate transporter substrate binding protein [Betaproteobacteria bacterium]